MRRFLKTKGQKGRTGSAARVAAKDKLLAVIERAVGKREHRVRELGERVDFCPLDESMELTALLVDEENVVIPTVLSEQSEESLRCWRGRISGHPAAEAFWSWILSSAWPWAWRVGARAGADSADSQ